VSSTSCEQKAREALKEEADAPVGMRKAVAKEMCRLLRSGKVDDYVEEHESGVDYLISRLEVREGDDNPDLKTKWNHWIGQMEFFDGGFEQYKVR